MRIKKRVIYGIIVGIVILVALFFYFKPFGIMQQNLSDTSIQENNSDKIGWSVDKNGYLNYPLDRGEIKFRRDDYSQTEGLLISKVIFESRGRNIYGFLVLPKSASDLLPGVVLLPGAGVAKESELDLAKKIAELDIAVLTIDQRGVGETNGNFPTLDEDYASFLKGQEPYQHLMVYDALRAYDLLYSAPFIDPNRIIIAGESLGGRIAVIAAAVDFNVKGALIISSSGFDFKQGNDTNKDRFIKSIDSDHYIGLITPRKLVMIHNVNDKIIPASSAVNSYSKAQEPKQFVLINDTSCNHGYCDSMHDGLVESLGYLIGISGNALEQNG